MASIDLERGGLHRILPYRQLGTPREKTDNGGFNGIWSRTKPKRGTHGIVSIPAADVPGIMLQTDDGTSVAFASAHTKSPMRGCRSVTHIRYAVRAACRSNSHCGGQREVVGVFHDE